MNNVLHMTARLFNPALNLYTHGWHENNPDAPRFYWGRDVHLCHRARRQPGLGEPGDLWFDRPGRLDPAIQVYYYNRPTSADAMHGYGPTLLVGAEMIKLLKNPAIKVQYRVRTYHYYRRRVRRPITGNTNNPPAGRRSGGAKETKCA